MDGNKRLEEIGVTDTTQLIAQEMLTLDAKEKLKNFEDPECMTTLYKIHDNSDFQLDLCQDGKRPLTLSAKIESKKLSESELIDTT